MALWTSRCRGRGRSSSRCRGKRSPSTSTVSRSGPSSTPPGPGCRSTRCSKASTPTPATSPRGVTAATRPPCRSRIWPAAGRGSPASTGASRSSPSTAARPGCSSRICTSGRARSGSAASSCATTTSPASGRSTATTTTAIPGKSSATGGLIVAPARIAWRLAAVNDVVVETPRATTLVLDAPGWPGHLAGQHVDVRLTAEDCYQAQHSYSVASAPEDASLALTVERREDGEVSPYLTDELRPGDELELRGPIGGYFVWRSEDGGPLLLIAGGSGLVPLMAMLRHRAAHSSTADTRTPRRRAARVLRRRN